MPPVSVPVSVAAPCTSTPWLTHRCTGKRIQRESRLVPELIYQIEQFEVALIKLSKASKVRGW